MEFGIIGTSIWQQNLPLLERLTIGGEERKEVLSDLKTKLGLDELVYVTTCNRVEFIYSGVQEADGPPILHRLVDFFFHDGREISFFPNDFYHFTGKEAITHLFRTVSSLESLVVGETQITGQFKQACQEAASDGMVGPILDSLIKEALAVAKKVKRDTDIGLGSVSMASLAASQVREQIGGVDNPVVALVGSGAMTLKLAKHLKDSTKARLLFVNRTIKNVQALAEQFDGEAMALDDFVQSPPEVDAIVSATSASEPVFDCAFADRLPSRPRPVLAIDMAIPRDFVATFSTDERFKLIDIPRLKAMCQGNLRQKFVEVSKANQIVRDAVTKFLSDRIEGSLKPIFHDSFKESIALAERALDDLFDRHVTSLPQEDREAVQRLVTKLISHSAFQPVRILSNRLVESNSRLGLEELIPVRKSAV